MLSVSPTSFLSLFLSTKSDLVRKFRSSVFFLFVLSCLIIQLVNCYQIYGYFFSNLWYLYFFYFVDLYWITDITKSISSMVTKDILLIVSVQPSKVHFRFGTSPHLGLFICVCVCVCVCECFLANFFSGFWLDYINCDGISTGWTFHLLIEEFSLWD